MYDHVVIPVDGSDEARRAARRGLALADAFDATVDVLHVVERRWFRLTASDDEDRRLRERGERILGEIEELAAGMDRPVTVEMREGKPVVEIAEFAEARGADVVVLGRQGLTGLGRRLLGGVTEGVLHRSDVPVLVVPDGEAEGAAERGYGRILLTTDGSENAAEAIPHGTAIAGRFGAELHVLNVVDLQAAGGAFDAGGLERAFVERFEERGREAVERAAEAVAGSAPELAVETAVERTTSYPGAPNGIREYVEDHGIELVVMGSHGRSNLRRQLLGSVASSVLRTVDVPVLVVKPAS